MNNIMNNIMNDIINEIINKSILYDYIIIHSDILFLLKQYNIDYVKQEFNKLFLKLIEENKTIFIPTFNWDFCSNQTYHYKNNQIGV